MGRKEQSGTSHVEALRSSSIIGGSRVIGLVIRMIRTKVIAVLLGPGGVGLEAVYDSVVNLWRTVFDLGISSSGVRQVAAAVGSGDDEAVSRTVYTLRRACLCLGIVSAVSLFLARDFVSRLAFGSLEQSANIGILSIILVFGALVGGQGALLQGMRRIGDLAKISILSTLAGAVVSIPIVVIWGRAGIPYYMVLTSGIGVLISWSFVRRVQIQAVAASAAQIVREASGLVRLGMAFLSSGLMSVGTLFLLRIMVTRQEGAEGAGQFQAASSLSMVYVGFILQAMSTDFYPRLTGVAEDNAQCNRMVNEQAEVSLLLALPGVLGTLAFAPWVIRVFYSDQFGMASEILSWQMAGTLLQLMSWPMGFVLLAKSLGTLFVLTEAAAWTFYIVLAWFGLRWFGLPGMGMAYLGLYLFHVVMIYAVVRKCSGFRWSGANIRLGLLGIAAVGTALWCRLVLPEPWATGSGAVLAVVAGVLSLRALTHILGKDRIKRLFQRFRLPFAFGATGRSSDDDDSK